jgi:hypothetical protein
MDALDTMWTASAALHYPQTIVQEPLVHGRAVKLMGPFDRGKKGREIYRKSLGNWDAGDGGGSSCAGLDGGIVEQKSLMT